MSTRVKAFIESVAAVHLDGPKEVRPTRFHLGMMMLIHFRGSGKRDKLGHYLFVVQLIMDHNGL